MHSAGIRINLQRTGSLNGYAFPINAIKSGVKVSQHPNQERSQLLNVLKICHCHMRLTSAYRYILQPFSRQNKMRKKVFDKDQKLCATVLSCHDLIHLSKLQFDFDFDCGQMRFK